MEARLSARLDRETSIVDAENQLKIIKRDAAVICGWFVCCVVIVLACTAVDFHLRRTVDTD